VTQENKRIGAPEYQNIRKSEHQSDIKKMKKTVKDSEISRGMNFPISNFLISILILFFILSGCFRPKPVIIPVVRIVEPQEGDTIKTANVLIRAEVTNESDILKVRFFDNNLFLGEVLSYPYEHLWETAFVSNGEHNLTAEAIDASGNKDRSPEVSVYVTKEDMYDWDLFNSPTSNDLNALFAFDSLNIWVCGNSGTILFYNDSAWELSTISINNLNALFFISQDKGWCVGMNTLFEFDNEGWTQLLPDSALKKSFLSIFVIDDTIGWVGDSQGKIFTFNGDSLEEYGLLDSHPITDILGFSSSDIWASCGGSLFHYDGANWFLDTTFIDEQINSLTSPDMSKIWAGGTHLFYYNGTEWEMRDLPFSPGVDSEVKSIYFSNPANGVACGTKGENGFILTYNGVEWKQESLQKDVPFSGIIKFSNGEGWAIGCDGTILHRQGK